MRRRYDRSLAAYIPMISFHMLMESWEFQLDVTNGMEFGVRCWARPIPLTSYIPSRELAIARMPPTYVE